MQEKIVDPILGDGGEIFREGDIIWAAFKKNFRPIKKHIIVLVSVINGVVSETERALFIDIENWFPKGIPEIIEAMLQKLGEYKTEELPATNQAQEHFQLEMIDIRDHISPSKCVLHFATDLDHYDWYARLSSDYKVEFCGPRD